MNTPVNIRIKQLFQGIANNGLITVPVAITDVPTSARNNNLLSNPYPSAIDANTFLAYNPILDGVIYLWKSTTSNSGEAGEAYNKADYIAYTRAGATAYAEIGTTPFNGMIATGQGFKVKALAPGNVIFNNCMRVSGNNGQFMRSSVTSIDRYKLNLTGLNGVGSQILVAYTPETTLAYDRMYDAESLSVSSTQLYSFLENTNKKLAINARPIFEITDVVKLGISKTEATPENYTISIVEKEGVFAASEVKVYLFDSLRNVYHDFARGSYTFNTASTELQNRFYVVYQRDTLGQSDIESFDVSVVIVNETIKIAANAPIAYVTIFDISGRLIAEFNVNNQNEFEKEFHFLKGIYIAKIRLNNGIISTIKLINKVN